MSKLSQAEKIVLDWKSRVNKLEEDNSKLRRAVEQSMTRLNRMSIDSDFLVDRLVCISIAFDYSYTMCSLTLLGFNHFFKYLVIFCIVGLDSL